ncbi:MAG: enoyl-CoA hydratase-related protein [Steroidobacteraceae bacterium]
MAVDNAYGTLIVTIEDQVATLLLNRPRARNAISGAMRGELRDALGQLIRNDAVRAIVLGGAGGAFCAGADLAEDAPPPPEQMLMEHYLPIVEHISTTDKPVIAAVQGAAAGVGMSLALACDLIVMGESAFFLAPFTRIGLVPDGGLCWLLVHQLGYRRAYEVAVNAERIAAAQALEWGLANTVVADKEVVPSAIDWARRLATGAQPSLGLVKRLLRLAVSSDYGTVYAAEAKAQEICGASEFFAEARSKFAKK